MLFLSKRVKVYLPIFLPMLQSVIATELSVDMVKFKGQFYFKQYLEQWQIQIWSFFFSFSIDI